LAAEERLQPQSLTRLSSELEQSGLIGRKRSNDDRRKITIAITARGRRVLLDDIAVRRDWLETALNEALDPVERGSILVASAVMVKPASHKPFTTEERH
jgi:DNA-binding MarR family transcriptional regulator